MRRTGRHTPAQAVKGSRTRMVSSRSGLVDSSATGTSKGPIKLDLKDSYGQFAYLHLGTHGLVR